MKRYLKLSGLALSALLLLTACGRGDINPQEASLWEQFVYGFAGLIKGLSLGGYIGIGIILVTLLMRLVLLPLYNLQMASSQKMRDLQPQLLALRAKYPGKDMASRNRLAEETNALYKQEGVNIWSNLLPLLIQMPILLGLFQALTRVDFLRQGHFLWMEIAKPDPYGILPILAAGLTFLSLWLTNKAAPEDQGPMKMMTYLMPVMILIIGFTMASGVALYWTVSNAFQVAQLLIFHNPFKRLAEREAQHRVAKEQAAKMRKAKKKAMKRR